MSEFTHKEIIEILGDNHQMTSAESPLRADAFVKTDAEKMQNIEKYFYHIMHELGLDMTDDSLQGTPHRVAKMFVNEIFNGLNPKNKPKVLSILSLNSAIFLYIKSKAKKTKGIKIII